MTQYSSQYVDDSLADSNPHILVDVITIASRPVVRFCMADLGSLGAKGPHAIETIKLNGIMHPAMLSVYSTSYSSHIPNISYRMAGEGLVSKAPEAFLFQVNACRSHTIRTVGASEENWRCDDWKLLQNVSRSPEDFNRRELDRLTRDLHVAQYFKIGRTCTNFAVHSIHGNI